MFIERRMDLPSDFADHALEEQEFFCANGYFPDPVDKS